jgi:23S rRNA (cytosine1962-C5)-methyltransferase
MTEQEKINYQAEIFYNRLEKRYKHLKKWAKRSDITCFRIYDKDIPEIPLVVDIYEDCSTCEKYLVIALYERHYEKDSESANKWILEMAKKAAVVFLINPENIFIKMRKKQHNNSQYEKQILQRNKQIIVDEQNARFKINLSEFLDTGLFFDHRPLRKIIRETCKGKSVLNLFCYTGSFSVYAAQGKAKKIDSVDLSKNYIEWAKENFSLKNITINENFSFYVEDSLTFLQKTVKINAAKYDIIILDPPTFSNSKKTDTTLDINRDYFLYINLCLKLLNKNGTLYFSTNSRKFSFDDSLIENKDVSICDITESTIPEDFRNKKIHKCWKLQKS